MRKKNDKFVGEEHIVDILAAEQLEKDRRDAIDQQQVLKGTLSTPSEINWTPATFTSSRKQLSSALGIVRNVDKPSLRTSETTSKSLVSYDSDDDDEEETS